MRILMINHSDPFAHGGGSYASHAYCRAFSDMANGNIDICIFAESNWPTDDKIKVNNYIRVKKRSNIKRIFSLITGDIQRYTSFLKKHLKDNPNVYDLIVLNGSYEGGALVNMCKRYGAKVITIHHNFDPEYAYDNCIYPLYREVYTYWVYRLQKKAYLNSDVNLFLTREDIAKCEKEFGKTPAKNELVGVFEFKDIRKTFFHINERKQLTFVITGSLCTVQGEDSIRYFFKDLYPLMPPDCRIIIAGRSPNQAVIDLCLKYHNVTLIPNPHDMMEVISSGDVYICPTRIGGGLKLRVLDGLRLGLPVITHRCSARGYDVFNGSDYFTVFSTPQEFSCAVGKVLNQYCEHKICKETVFNLFCQSFSYEAGLHNLKNILSVNNINC